MVTLYRKAFSEKAANNNGIEGTNQTGRQQDN
jgi:hypothetical protein